MRRWMLIPVLFLLVACVDKIIFDIPADEDQLVIEGSITNAAGPYTILLSKSFNNAFPQRTRTPVKGAQIDLYEDDIKIDTYFEIADGTYQTNAATKGRVGHTYFIKIRTTDSQEFTSEPELLQDGGSFDNIQKEFQRTPYDKYNIYIDAHPPTPQTYMRWSVVGTWHAISFPERATTPVAPGVDFPTPLACSGYIYNVDLRALVKVGECTCCECWVTERESSFNISDPYFLSAAGYAHTNAGVVKVNRRTFFEKYRVEIIQMSISSSAHEFFRQLKSQSEGAGSLFQPSFGEIIGNVKSGDGKRMLGFFWAAGTTRTDFFIEKDELPVDVGPIDTVSSACNYFGESTYTKPAFWE